MMSIMIFKIHTKISRSKNTKKIRNICLAPLNTLGKQICARQRKSGCAGDFPLEKFHPEKKNVAERR